MIIKKVALGNQEEAFIEDSFTDGFNIISSDDNNKGKTVLIQSMMYALGGKEKFPSSFNKDDITYYIEFEENNIIYKIVRKKDTFAVKYKNKLTLLNSLTEFKVFWTRNIFQLPSIFVQNKFSTVYLELFIQVFFHRQDGVSTDNITDKGLYNKDNFKDMLFSMLNAENTTIGDIDTSTLKKELTELKEERKVLQKESKIKKTKATERLVSTYNREAFEQNQKEIEAINTKISEKELERNKQVNQKFKWDNLYKELKSINSKSNAGELVCLDCNSNRIMYKVKNDSTIKFDVTTKEMKENILSSISEKISISEDEIDRLSYEINELQKNLQQTIQEKDISFDLLIYHKQQVFDSKELFDKIDEIDEKIKNLENKCVQAEKLSKESKEKKIQTEERIVSLMNSTYSGLIPDSKSIISNIFTKSNETFSGSESVAFYSARLFALQQILEHHFPIIIDSFRSDLGTLNEQNIIDLFQKLPNQKIFTTTLKQEELGKYDEKEDINHIDYSIHMVSHILSPNYVDEFRTLLGEFNIIL